MALYEVYAGLGGGFGGAHSVGVIEFDSYEEAMDYAYETACDIYEGFTGMYGLRTISEIMREEDVDEDEAFDIYCDEREGWIEYYVEEVEEQNADDNLSAYN